MGNCVSTIQDWRRTPMEIEDENFWTALRFGRMEAVHQVLSSSPNPARLLELRDYRRLTPLACAALQRDQLKIKLLLRYNADPNEPSGTGTPLICALKGQWNRVNQTPDQTMSILRLLRGGASPNAYPGSDDLTPLQRASRLGLERATKLLLEYGADVNYRQPDEWTPFEMAIYYFSPKVAIILLQGGAEVPTEIVQDIIRFSENSVPAFHYRATCYILYYTRQRCCLAHLARQVIRRQINLSSTRHIPEHINELPIPKAIRNYLNYQEDFQYMMTPRELGNWWREREETL